MSLPNDDRRPAPGDDLRRDADLQADPELREGPAGVGRIAIYGIAVVILLGAVFFGLSNGPTNTATTIEPKTSADISASTPKTPAAVRDVTPNREPGTTTGAAPAQSALPAQPPQAGPAGAQVNQGGGSN